MNQLRVLQVAQSEILAAARWYRKHDEKIAEAFASQIRASFDTIQRFPLAGPSHHHHTRRIVLRYFPYEIVYIANSDDSTVIAVAHTRKRPAYWAKRKP